MKCGTLFFLVGMLYGGALAQTTSVLATQNDVLLRQIQAVHSLTDSQMVAIRAIFVHSGYIGQGNPAITKHPVAPEACDEKLKNARVDYENGAFEEVCGAKYMAPLYNPATQRMEEAKACIDQFEFPNIPCAYPVVWVRAKEAAEICAVMGKRMCDAHEWEGGCAGDLEPPDYRFALTEGVSPSVGVGKMRAAHNVWYQAAKEWSYGPEYRREVCATGSFKSPGCEGGQWDKCGSNTYPLGFFPECHSSLGVYDINGNAAEHMNLPLTEDQMASRGSQTLGYTEMKGSWFIWDTYRAHEDWCRWRAPFWHGSKVMDKDSHHNYHLGFRCCKTVGTD
jgi:formylglycine-generating enzyme required for sulfatase activity